MSLTATLRWLDRLRAEDPATFDTGLSPAGAREAWAAALDALTPAALTAAVAAGQGQDATFVAARTVFTAPVEWLAVLLARGGRVHLKTTVEGERSAQVLATLAAAEGLPLRVAVARAPVADPLVVAMGSDASIASIAASIPADSRFLGFGHRWSAAWIGGDDPALWRAVARDAALYDGRGCMSPVVVLSPRPLAEATAGLAAAMTEVQAELPVGDVSDVEAAAIRARRALARVVGVVAEGEGWSVHGLPMAQFRPMSLPRSLAVVSVSEGDARALLADPRLSTLGTDQPFARDGVRVCAPGEMQRPPLLRRHDGVDWIRATAR